MESIKISKEKLMKVKDIVIFVLLSLWMIMPILQSFKVTNNIVESKNLYFTLMKTVAIVGIGTTIPIIYDKLKNSDNKKQLIKELVPILLFVIYMIWTLISCHEAAIKKQAFNGSSYRKEGYFMYINYAGFFLCAMLLENKKLRKTLLNIFLVATIFLIVVSRISDGKKMFTNIFTNSQIDDSVFYQFNHYGYYLMMSVTCALGLFITEKNKIIRIIYLAVYALITYASIYNDTFGCYLSILTIIILYGIYALIKKTNRKSIFIAIVIFALLSGITSKNNINLAYSNLSELGQDIKIIFCKIMNIELKIDGKEVDVDKKFEKTGTSRMELWINAIKFISEKPIIGHGPDNLRTKYLMKGIEQDRPHNLIIYLACVSGIPGMLIYITAVGIIVVKGIRKLFNKNKEGTIYLIVVITYLISSMFGNSMYYTSPYFFIFLGGLMHYNLKTQED